MFGLFFRKFKVKTLGLDKIDVTMVSSFSDIEGSEKIYTIELLFDNRNSKDKKTSIGQFIRFNQFHAHNKRNNLFYPIYHKEYESVYLPQGKMKVIFKLVAANADDVLQYLYIKGRNPIVIPGGGGASAQDEIVLQQISTYKQRYYRNIKWSILLVVILLVIFPIILVLGGILLLLSLTLIPIVTP